MRLVLVALLILTASLPLAAATAKDLVGTWTLDLEATWAGLQDLPQMKQLKPEHAKIAKDGFTAKAAGMTWTFTETRVTTVVDGQPQEEAYVVISVNGDTIVTESTTADGTKERSTIRLIDGGMTLVPDANPLAKVVLKRK